MSQSPFTILRGAKKRGAGFPMHTHKEAQLTFAATGMVQAHTPAGRWLVPQNLALWVPAGMPHELELLTDAELWVMQLDLTAAKAWAPPVPLDRAFALHVTPLLRTLLDAAFTKDIDPVKAELVVRLMLHELTEIADASTFLPMPTSAVGSRVADAVLKDRKNLLNVDELAARAATSIRTLSRLFPSETGLTFKAWRQRARIVHAMDRLAIGTPVSRVSTELGFSSVASFSSAFRQVTGMTPTAFLGGAQ